MTEKGADKKESLNNLKINNKLKIGADKCPNCGETDTVRLYTSMFKVVNGKDVCPLICDGCNVIWWRDEQ